MKPLTQRSTPWLSLPSLERLLYALVVIVGLAAFVAACGGGGGATPIGTGGTGALAVTQGTISGFGSVIVNGKRFEDNAARIEDDEGKVLVRDDLRIGMRVNITSSTPTGTSTATDPIAQTIVVEGGSKGPISSINAASRSFVVLGQTVIVGTGTVFAPSLPNGFASLTTTQIVEVHGLLNPQANTLQATLISREDNANEYRLRGMVANLNAGSTTFKVGPITINYTTADVRGTLQNNQLVKLRLSTTPAGTDTYTALRVRPYNGGLDDTTLANGVDEAEIEGLVTAFTSTASFSVNGIPVDASSASFPRGSAVTLGGRVEVKGTLSGTSPNLSLKAREVKVEDAGDNDNTEVQLRGAISSLATGSQTFVVRGVTVRYGGGGVEFRNGDTANLANGVTVDVKAQPVANSSEVQATRIEFR